MATAKARTIAVFPLRSTPDLQATAASLAQELTDRLANAQGYDAQLMPEPSANRADAAAAIGAEFYVTGQVLPDASGYEIVLATFQVASDHEISNIRVVSKDGHLPADVTLASIMKSSPEALAGAPSAVKKLLLVPFQEPGSKDQALEFATAEFFKKLVAHGIAVVQGDVVNHVETVANMAALCQKSSVTGALIGTVTHEQHAVFLDGMPTSAVVRVSELDCEGKTVWRGFGTSDTVYHWANPAAAISEVIDKALDSVVSQFST